MRLMSPNLFLWFLGVMLVTGGVSGQSTTPVPIDDAAAEEALLPAGLSRSAPEFFGNYAHRWTGPDGDQIILYYGDFSLHIGERRLNSRDAVIWMRKSQSAELTYYHFEVFLSHQAYVRETAGTITTGPTLFVTLNSSEPPSAMNADVIAEVPADGTELYQEASRVRSALAKDGDGLERDLRVVDPRLALVGVRAKAAETVQVRADTKVVDNRRGLVTADGDVYLSRGLVDSAAFLEIRADAAVIFLENYAGSAEVESDGEGESDEAPSLDPDSPFPTEAPETPGAPSTGLLGSGQDDLGTSVTGAYLTGDVLLTRGEQRIRANELYYDFQFNRALILDAVMWSIVPARELPLYVRADKVRQLSSTEYFAQTARVSTSEFHTPHVHLGAERVYLTDLTPGGATNSPEGIGGGAYRMYDTTLNVEGVPILYWPYTAGDFRRSETAIRSIRAGYSDDFGAAFQAKWYLFGLLGVEDPEGVDAILRTDYFTDRGPGFGPEIEYEQENRYGLLRGYYIYDDGEDNLGDFRDGTVDHKNRGYLTWRHREFLPDDWELTLETSYVSDPNFLEEYFRNIFEEDKAQETLAYLKKQKDNWAFTTLAQWRINDFMTQTEHLPDAAFRLIGEPLGEIASLYSTSHVGAVRYRPDDRRIFDEDRFWDNEERTDVTYRMNQRNEIDFPIKLGPVSVVPYAMGQAGWWDGTPHDSAMGRILGSAGIRTGTQIWRLFEDVSSDILDVNGVRHIIEPQSVTWASASNHNSFDLSPFDQEIEGVDDFYGTSLALRQRWQTKRGAPGEWRTVDWIKFDVELNLFGNTPPNELDLGRFYAFRPENSTARNHIKTDFLYRISDTTAILSDSNIDLTDGELDIFNISYVVERTPRFSYALGWRYIGETDSNLAGIGVNYKISEKYRFATRFYYDLDRSKTETIDIVVIRKFPRWYGALIFRVNEIEEDFGLSVAVWPEGAPNAAIGGRDYIPDLGDSTGLRPEE